MGGGEGEGAVFGDVDGLAEGDVGVLDGLGLEEGWWGGQWGGWACQSGVSVA